MGRSSVSFSIRLIDFQLFDEFLVRRRLSIDRHTKICCGVSDSHETWQNTIFRTQYNNKDDGVSHNRPEEPKPHPIYIIHDEFVVSFQHPYGQAHGNELDDSGDLYAEPMGIGF